MQGMVVVTFFLFWVKDEMLVDCTFAHNGYVRVLPCTHSASVGIQNKAQSMQEGLPMLILKITVQCELSGAGCATALVGCYGGAVCKQHHLVSGH